MVHNLGGLFESVCNPCVTKRRFDRLSRTADRGARVRIKRFELARATLEPYEDESLGCFRRIRGFCDRLG